MERFTDYRVGTNSQRGGDRVGTQLLALASMCSTRCSSTPRHTLAQALAG